MRWFLIDRYDFIQPHVSLRALKLLSNNEFFLERHFPWKPTFPETLLLEMMAQAGGVLAGIDCGFSKNIFLGKIEKCEFLKSLHPPASVQIRATLVAEDSGSAWMEMTLSDDEGEAARSKILFVLLEPLSGTGSSQPVVFTESFLKTYNLAQFKKLDRPRGAEAFSA
jgi:3-hydroxymyristoyl/3-hydroxydecanoyl-(acyl carrier protein) dehydratase